MSNRSEPEFDRFAGTYRDVHRACTRISGEEPDYFAAYKVDYMAERLGSIDAPRRLLDFGCGVGGSMPHLRRRFPGARLCGVDESGESLAVAEAANPEVEFLRTDKEHIPLPDSSVDVAMAACVYHHIAPAQRSAWTSELKRVLRPGGHVFIFEHNPLNPLTRKVVRDCPFDEDAVLLPRRESVALLRGNGFREVSTGYIVFFPQAMAMLRPLERYLRWLPLGAQYVAQGVA